MRTDPRYTRATALITDEAIPRLTTGGIALCHSCQRAIYFTNGFLNYLIRAVEDLARLQQHARYSRLRTT